MQRSLELANVKEEIEKLYRDRHFIDKKIEEKTHIENDLTEKCIRHLQVLRRKGATPDSYCPKKRGVTSTPVKSSSPYTTPTKPYIGNHAPNYFPAPHAYMTAAEHAAYGKNFTSPIPRHGIVDNHSFAGPSPQKPVASPRPFLSGTPSCGPNLSLSVVPQDRNRTQETAVVKPGNISQQYVSGFAGQPQQRFPHQPMRYGAAGSYTCAPAAQNMAQSFNAHGNLYGSATVSSSQNVAQPFNVGGNSGSGVVASNAGFARNTFGMGSDEGSNNWDGGDQLTEAELIDYVEKEDNSSKTQVNDGGPQDSSDNGVNCPTDVSPSISNDADEVPSVPVSVDESGTEVALGRNGVEHTEVDGVSLDGVQSASRKLFT